MKARSPARHVAISPVFWGWALLVFCALSAGGFVLARLMLPAPLNYVHTSYLSVAVPQGWRCARGGMAYVCGLKPGTDRLDPRSAVMIFTAKETGDHDSFEAYRAHLEQPRQIGQAGSDSAYSVVEEVSERVIVGRRWIVGRHLHSEIRNYRTWYFATVADEIAVLVTFCAHRDSAEIYLDDVETALANLMLMKQVK